MQNLMSRFIKDESGATAIEYCCYGRYGRQYR